MSNSKFCLDTRKSGKLPEKSNFAQTCNLLSQYMKEKGNLRNLTLGKHDALETSRVTTPRQTINFLPLSTSSPDTTNNASCSKPEPDAGQMTIFYGGKVYVFNNFPAEKVMEMVKANKVNHQFTGGYAADPTNERCNSTASPSSSNPAFDFHQAQAIGSDMPIARRASLNRFVEKRKDRIENEDEFFPVLNEVVKETIDCSETIPESTRNGGNGTMLCLGQEFADIYHLRDHLRMYGILNKFELKGTLVTELLTNRELTEKLNGGVLVPIFEQVGC